jgi:hypothetical protein
MADETDSHGASAHRGSPTAGLASGAVALVTVAIAVSVGDAWPLAAMAIGLTALGTASGVFLATCIHGTPTFGMWFSALQRRRLSIGLILAWVWVTVLGNAANGNAREYELAGVLPLLVSVWAFAVLLRVTGRKPPSDGHSSA